MKRTLTALIIGLYCFSVSSQNNVSLLGSLPYTDELSDIWGYADGNGKEYALVGVYNGFSIVDISEPGLPNELHFIPGPNSPWRDVKVWNDHAFITNESSGGLRIVDLTGLPDSISYNNWSVTYNSQTLSSAHNIFIDENGFGYIVGSNIGVGGALIVDLNGDPKNPSLEGVYDTRYVHDCYVRGDTLWTAEINNGIFSVIDVSIKSSPAVLATQSTPSNFAHNIWIGNNGSHVYTTDEVSSAFIGAYDVSSLSNISQSGTFRSNPGSGVIPHNVFVRDDFAIISYYRDGVVIADVSNPDNIVQSGFYDTSPNLSGNGFNGCWGVYPYLPSGNIIASDIENGLLVLSPNYVRACFLEGTITDSTNGLPLSNVNVMVPAESLTTNTDLGGNYQTGTINSGSYDVIIAKQGYKSKTIANVNFQNGITTILNESLAPAVTFTLAGSVVEAGSGNPVPNAKVQFNNMLSQTEVLADANGNFMIPDFPAGEYEIYTGKWGFNLHSQVQILNPSNNNINLVLSSGYEDDFVLDLGWSVSSTASSGFWEIGEPIGTSLGGLASNPDLDISTDLGESCYMTGNGGGSAGTDDVDNGNTILTSPAADISSYSDPYLNFYWWFFTGGGSIAPNDTVIYSLNNGISEVEILRIDASNSNQSKWNEAVFRISDFVSPTANVSLKVTVSDISGTGHVVESALDGFSIFDSVQCQVPAPVSSQILNSNDVLLNWSSITNAEGYLIEGKEAGSGGLVQISISNGQTDHYTAKNLAGNKTYVWHIQTVCNSSSGISSQFTQFDTILLYCDPPQSLNTTNIGPTSASLNWDPVPGAENYSILGKQVGTSTIISITVSSSSSSFLATGLSPSTTYQWTIRQACDFTNGNFTYSKVGTIESFTTSVLKSSVNSSLFNVYPNPTSGVLQIEGDDLQSIELYSSTGNQLLIKRRGSEIDNKLDISEFPVGIYYLHIHSKEGIFAEKVIKF